MGVLRAQQGRSEEALAEIGAALAIRPDDPDALLNYASMLKTLNRPDEALAGFGRALAAAARAGPKTLNNRGTVLQTQRRFEEALADYDAALAVSPDYVEALSNRGSVLQDLKRPAEALGLLTTGLCGWRPTMPPRSTIAAARFWTCGALRTRWHCFDRVLALKPQRCAGAEQSRQCPAGLAAL